MVASSSVSPPLRRLFGTVVAVRADLLPEAARALVGNGEHVARYELRDRLEPKLDWQAAWTSAVARGKDLERATMNRTTEEIANAVVPRGGAIVRDVREVAEDLVEGLTSRLPGGKDARIQERGKSAIGAALTTPLTKGGVAADVAFSTVTGVAEAALRGVKATDAEGHVDTATSIAYEVSSGVAAGAVGTLVSTVATPVGGAAAAIATKVGIDSIRDPIVWKCAELVAGVRAAFSRK